MAFVTFAYGVNQYECTFFPKQFKTYSKLLRRPTAFFVAGCRDDRDQVIVNELADVVDIAQEEGWDPDKVVDIGRGRHGKKKRRRPRLKRKVA
jgi:hypothetical protein